MKKNSEAPVRQIWSTLQKAGMDVSVSKEDFPNRTAEATLQDAKD